MDKYDAAIAYLTANPSQIGPNWLHWRGTKGGCLFQRVGGHSGSGCLTMIRLDSAMWTAPSEELTRAIVADDRIPTNPLLVTVAHLPVFAEWQRRLDREIRSVAV